TWWLACRAATIPTRRRGRWRSCWARSPSRGPRRSLVHHGGHDAVLLHAGHGLVVAQRGVIEREQVAVLVVVREGAERVRGGVVVLVGARPLDPLDLGDLCRREAEKRRVVVPHLAIDLRAARAVPRGRGEQNTAVVEVAGQREQLDRPREEAARRGGRAAGRDDHVAVLTEDSAGIRLHPVLWHLEQVEYGPALAGRRGEGAAVGEVRLRSELLACAEVEGDAGREAPGEGQVLAREDQLPHAEVEGEVAGLVAVGEIEARVLRPVEVHVVAAAAHRDLHLVDVEIALARQLEVAALGDFLAALDRHGSNGDLD